MVHAWFPGYRPAVNAGSNVSSTHSGTAEWDNGRPSKQTQLLIGFAGAFRRSELVALNVEDLEETPEGLRVAIRRSKTDQEGHGHVIAIPRGMIACSVAALKAWLEAGAITEGPVFRPIAKGERIQSTRLTDRSVAAS